MSTRRHSLGFAAADSQSQFVIASVIFTDGSLLENWFKSSRPSLHDRIIMILVCILNLGMKPSSIRAPGVLAQYSTEVVSATFRKSVISSRYLFFSGNETASSGRKRPPEYRKPTRIFNKELSGFCLCWNSVPAFTIPVCFHAHPIHHQNKQF